MLAHAKHAAWFREHLEQCNYSSAIQPFESNREAYVGPGENEFDKPDLADGCVFASEVTKWMV